MTRRRKFAHKKFFHIIKVVFCVPLGCFTLAAVIIFHRDNKWTRIENHEPFHYGWSFSLAIIAIVVSAVISLMGLFICIYANDKEIQKVNYTKQRDLTDAV